MIISVAAKKKIGHIYIYIYIYIYIPWTVKKNPPGGFWAITRYHSIGEVPGSVEMLPISLPELPIPTRAGFKSTKP